MVSNVEHVARSRRPSSTITHRQAPLDLWEQDAQKPSLLPVWYTRAMQNVPSGEPTAHAPPPQAFVHSIAGFVLVSIVSGCAIGVATLVGQGVLPNSGLAHMTCPDPGKKYFLTVDVHRTIALDWLVYVVVRMYAHICCT